MPPRESPRQSRSPADKLLRAKLHLAESIPKSGIRVLPGRSWAVHYPHGGAVRQEKLQGLLEGRYQPEDVVNDIRPDALLFDEGDLDRMGVGPVNDRIRAIGSCLQHYDYRRFAEFVAGMKGKNIDLDTIQGLYDGVSKTRLHHTMLDALGATGIQQLQRALQNDAQRSVAHLDHDSPLQKVLQTLGMDALRQKGLLKSEVVDSALSKLSPEERAVFDGLQPSFSRYTAQGEETAYEQLVEAIRQKIPGLPPPSPPREESPEMEKLREELKQFFDKMEGPGTNSDITIPPEDRDEIGNPRPPSPSESREKGRPQVMFTITPSGSSKAVFTGSFCTGRKSFYSKPEKTWSKQKVLSPYQKTITGTERQTISGTINPGLTAIPIPNHYGLDVSTLRGFSGQKPQLFRDQTGCFYIHSSAQTNFEVNFLKETPPFLGRCPIAEDLEPLYPGTLSPETEAAIAMTQGSNIQKAEMLRQYLWSRHFYPGGGDLQMAEALQYKLLSESTEANYFQNLDSSEYLECRSANTLFIAMARKAGVPARMVVGHEVQGARLGKAEISTATGHAWAEIWDGTAWRKCDATPPPKPQDKKKKEEKKPDDTPTEEADDGGMEKPQPEEPVEEEAQKKVKKKLDEFGDNPDELPEASEEDVEEGERKQQESKSKEAKDRQKKQTLEQKIQDAKSFEELEKLKKKIQDAEDLLGDSKKDLEEKAENKEKQMENEIEDNLDQMSKDGFIDEEKKNELMEQLKKKESKERDRIKKEMEEEERLYDEYERIREEMMPLVDEWYKRFVELLPKTEEPEFDEDTFHRQSRFDRRSIKRPRNLLFGTIKNPRIFKPNIKPRFLAAFLLDVSGSMHGEKLRNATKLLVFYCELLSRISAEYGYIRFSIDVFSDTVTSIKGFGQNYDSSERYEFDEGIRSTIKVRLMKGIQTSGGTNMLPAIQAAAKALTDESFYYPNHVSALYFMGDGGDTCGNTSHIHEFMTHNEHEEGFGTHLKSAILLGDENQRHALSAIFGNAHTSVAPDFDSLLRTSMEQFERDLEEYVRQNVDA